MQTGVDMHTHNTHDHVSLLKSEMGNGRGQEGQREDFS